MKNKTPEERARHAEEQRSYRLRHPYDKEKQRESMRKHRKLHPMKEWEIANTEKHRAHRAVDGAVQRKKLIKPSCCSACKNPFPQAQIQGHHEDYTKRLEVIWLCRSCHMGLHRRERELQRKQVQP